MRKLIAWLLLLIFTITSLLGCWSRREVEDLAIAAALGFDIIRVKGVEKFRVTVQVICTQAIGNKDGGAGSGMSPIWIETSIGNTVNEAIRNLSTRSPRQLFLSHVKVIALGERAAKHGLHEFIDFMQRQREIRLRTWLVVTKGEAFDLLQVKSALETLPSAEISGLFTNTQPNVSKAVVIDLKEFIIAMASSGRDPVLTNITINPLGPKEMAEDEQMIKEPPGFFRLQGTAVFKGDRLIGYLGDEETMGYLWVDSKMEKGVITLSGKKKNKSESSIELTSSKLKLTPKIDNNKIIIKLKIKAIGDLGEHSEVHKIVPELPLYEKNLSKKIKTIVYKVIKKVQSEYRSDIFGFGEAIHRKYPKEWKNKYEKNWNDEYFPKVDVIVDVEAKINRTGMIGDSIPIK